MGLRILVVPDKFKGTLTAQAAAAAIADGWRRTRPSDVVELQPMSDGGDGFGEIVSRAMGAKPRVVATVDAAHRPRRATWWWHAASHTAIIESANSIGLALLPTGNYHPFALDTFGLGAVVLAAARQGAERCLVGLGGSATNDAGFGLARALGWRFWDENGGPIERWTQLAGLTRVQSPKKRRPFPKLVGAVDVKNPLLGVRGASRIYGPQKGLQPNEITVAERHLRRLVRVSDPRQNYAKTPGAGAAGGLGFGLLRFLGARLEPGFDLFLRHTRLRERLKGVDLVITGEGSLDRSSFMGKGVGEIARLCRQMRLPCIGLAGVVPEPEVGRRWLNYAAGITPTLTSPEHAKAAPDEWLSRLAERAATAWDSGAES